MSWILDYDGVLKLYFPEKDTDQMRNSVFYKLSLKRYVHQLDIGCAVFKSALTYLDFKKIILLCQKQSSDLTVSLKLREYIDSREIYVERRFRLGGEVKKRDPKLSEQYAQYKFAVDSAMIRPLREQQMWDSFFMCTMQKSCNFSVPGSGKTASVLGMYAYLREKALVNRILVICPKNAFGSWIDEFSACFGEKLPVRVLNIHDTRYKNTNDRRNALRYETGRCNLILVNYESVGSLEEALVELASEKTLLVFDEVHKVKRVGGEHSSHALKLAKVATHIVALTGTPIPNSYLDVYNLLHILFADEYDTFFDFSVPMLKNPTPQDIEVVNDKLQPFFCRTTKGQLGVPAANPDTVYSVHASPTENRLMHILQMKYRKNKLGLLIRLLQLESNPKLLLRNLCLRDFQYLLDDSVETDEIDFADYSEEIQNLIEGASQASKFTQCADLVQSLAEQGKTCVVWCIFVDSITQLSQELEHRGISTRCIYGEVALEDRQQILRDFRSGKIQVLLTNPHTLAESVSLHTVCHDAIYFEYSYNLVHLLQSKDRIHRLGLPEGQYTQYHFMQLAYQTDTGEWSLDAEVYQRLKDKEQTMLDAIDNHLLEIMPTSDEDLELIFAKLF